MSTTDTGKDFLEHHGVKGMQWGKRKRRNEGDRAKTFGNKGAKKLKPKNLSDEEINKAIKRMELEKKYTQLSKGRVGAGKDYATGIMSNSGKAAAGAAVGTGVSFLVGRALKQHFG